MIKSVMMMMVITLVMILMDCLKVRKKVLMREAVYHRLGGL